jgi:hypothetical protein
MNSNFASGVHNPGAATYTQEDYGQAADIHGFRFSEKRGRLDWKQLEEVDMDRIIREVDIDRVERLL